MSEPSPLPPTFEPSAGDEEVLLDLDAQPGSVGWLLVTRLSVMMFLQFVPLGLWVVTLSSYIGENTGTAGNGMFDASFVGIAGTSGALGALLAPLVFGTLADSWFRSERLLAMLHVGCAAMLVFMWNADRQLWFFMAMIVYFQFSGPTMTLSHSLALRHLNRSKKTFPVVRAWGTGGWIAALWLVGSIAPWWRGVPSVEIESSTWPMVYAMVAHLVATTFAITLPYTPPLARGVGWSTLLNGCASLIRSNPRLLRFLLVSFCATISAQFYNMYVNLYLNSLQIDSAATKIAYGQIAEILCMLLLPWLLIRWGPKRVFVVGVAAWVVRFVCFAYGGSAGLPLLAVYIAILLHGACYTFVYVTGYIYVDHASSPQNQSAAQGLLAMVTSGVGHLVGSLLSGAMQARYLTPPGMHEPPYNWNSFFLVAAVISVLSIALFWLLMGFHREVMPGEVQARD